MEGKYEKIRKNEGKKQITWKEHILCSRDRPNYMRIIVTKSFECCSRGHISYKIRRVASLVKTVSELDSFCFNEVGFVSIPGTPRELCIESKTQRRVKKRSFN